MNKSEKLTAIDAFKHEIMMVCKKHGLGLEPYTEEYDEFDSESGLYIIPLNSTRYVPYVEYALMRGDDIRRWKG